MRKLLLSTALVLLCYMSKAQTCNFTYSANGLVVTFTDVTSWGSCTPSPSWNFGDPASGGNNTSMAANPTHTFSSAGTYTVCLSEAPSGTIQLCPSSFATKCTTLTVPSPSGIKNLESDLKSYSISPNPTDGDFVVSYSLRSETSVKIEMFNLLGEKVSGTTNELQSKGNYSINSKDIAMLSKGIYFVKLSLNDNSKTTKVIVQ